MGLNHSWKGGENNEKENLSKNSFRFAGSWIGIVIANAKCKCGRATHILLFFPELVRYRS